MTKGEAVKRARYVVECLEDRGDSEADKDAEAVRLLIKAVSRGPI
jgi:hypothetical protein